MSSGSVLNPSGCLLRSIASVVYSLWEEGKELVLPTYCPCLASPTGPPTSQIL